MYEKNGYNLHGLCTVIVTQAIAQKYMHRSIANKSIANKSIANKSIAISYKGE